MIPGFDIPKELQCEGIIGDGCGGGRLFYAKGCKLYVYDPMTKGHMELFDAGWEIESIEKKGCIVTIVTCNKHKMGFDLSAMKITSKEKL